MPSKNTKVFVGLSGGVDSSVAAALLVEQGYDVTGVFMKNWSRDVAGHHCPWKEDLASARSVAAHLGISLKVYDFEQQYFEAVTKYMVETYKKGLTPNPDIMCNQEIKFKVFYKKCLSEGAEMIATGHYARLSNQAHLISSSDPAASIQRSSSTPHLLFSDLPRTSSELNTQPMLMTAIDKSKDQTYFLYRMNPSIASKVLFPIGKYKKTEVRKLAEKFNLPTARRPDSQGLCFVGNVPMKDFLAEFIKPKEGRIIDEAGNIVGEHDGAFSYTIGQRHGLGVGGGQPYFVYKIDTKTNEVFVSTNESILDSSEFTITDCVWWDEQFSNNNFQFSKNKKLTVKVRYRSKAIPCKISLVIPTEAERSLKISRQALPTSKQARNDKWRVVLSTKERAITPGQSAVLYVNNVVIGGGIIT